MRTVDRSVTHRRHHPSYLVVLGLATAAAAFAGLAGVALAAQPTDGSTPAPANIEKLVTTVPVSTLNRVGVGDVAGPPAFSVTKLNGSELRSKNRPEFLAIELAWCPHCAVTSWGMAIALSRFGTLSNLGLIDTGTYFGQHGGKPPYNHTHGLSFFGASYHSRFLSFVNVVLQDVNGHSLQKPTKAENQAIGSFDPHGQIPADDFGGKYGFVGSGVSPGVIAHMGAQKIAHTLADPSNPVAKAIDGLANLFTAAICKTTNGHPGSVCKSKGVTAASKGLPQS